MYRSLWRKCLLMFGLAMWCVPISAGDGPRASYTITIGDPADRRVDVRLDIRGLSPNRHSLELRMPKGFAFVQLDEPVIDGPTSATANGRPATVTRGDDPYAWEVATSGASRVSVSYAIPMRHRDLPAVRERDAYEWPYVADDHAMLAMPTMLLLPEGVERARVRFVLPEDWACSAPWPRIGDGFVYEATAKALRSDYIAVGAWSMHEVRGNGYIVRIAIAPGQAELERIAVEPISKIVSAELELFGSNRRGRYLFLFGRADVRGASGSPKANSMTLMVHPSLLERGLAYLPHLVAHEFFHTWSGALFEAPDSLRWFSEGFTDYYAYQVSARLGLVSWEGLAGKLGSLMEQVSENPHFGSMALAEAGGPVFFTDRDAYRLVYDGGTLTAAWLDMAVRQHGKTLDDLMRVFINDPRWNQTGVAPSLDDFLRVVARFTDEPTAERFRAMVAEPFAMDPVEAFTAVGVAVRREQASADLSLRANLRNATVLDIDPMGVGYRVGVRAGDRFLVINGQKVANGKLIRDYWRQPVDGRIRVELVRDGRRVEIDEPVPEVVRYVVPAEPWEP